MKKVTKINERFGEGHNSWHLQQYNIHAVKALFS